MYVHGIAKDLLSQHVVDTIITIAAEKATRNITTLPIIVSTDDGASTEKKIEDLSDASLRERYTSFNSCSARIHFYLTSGSGFFLINAGSVVLSEGSSAISVDFSYLECVACVRSEATSSEGLTHHLTRDISPTLFLELH